MIIDENKLYIVANINVSNHRIGYIKIFWVKIQEGAGTMCRIVEHQPDNSKTDMFGNVKCFECYITKEKIDKARFGQKLKTAEMFAECQYLIICESELFLNRAISKTPEYKKIVEQQKKVVGIKTEQAKKAIAELGHIMRISKIKMK